MDVLCEICGDDGVEEGCPECGLWWPSSSQRVVDGVEYRFIVSVEEGEELHKQYQRLKKKGVQILLEPATDRWHKPHPPWIDVLVTDEAAAIIEKEGLFCL
jgi:hypothetical protein